jgi:hypothetical protein
VKQKLKDALVLALAWTGVACIAVLTLWALLMVSNTCHLCVH